MSLFARWSEPETDTARWLVDDACLQLIHQAATANTAPSLVIQREVQQVLLGERQSAFAGSGYEFAENVALHSGDDARFINWRLFARTGEYYRKAFYEERRPQVWLVVDRGPHMCFGTHTRLKLALAAQLALLHLFVAQRQQLLTGAVLLQGQAEWLRPAQGHAAVHKLIYKLRQPCPPPGERDTSHALPSLLAQLNVRLRPGCIVILYSDFQNLQGADMNRLHALSEQHSVLARHIVDRSELELPAAGQYHFAAQQIEQAVDCTDGALREEYRQAMARRHAQVRDWLQQAGCDYQRYTADADLFTPQAIRHA